MLRVRGLHTYYGDLQALRGVSLHVRQGEIVSVIGNNGAGKTTTLMTISGVLAPRKGEVEFDGKRIDSLKPAEIVELACIIHERASNGTHGSSHCRQSGSRADL